MINNVVKELPPDLELETKQVLKCLATAHRYLADIYVLVN